MASNPMQRKVRNSFLLGILVMLAIAILIGALVFFGVVKPKMDKEKEKANQIPAHVYRLKSGVSVKYGEEITNGMVESVEIPVAKQQTNFVLSKTKNSKGELQDNPFPDGYKSKIELSEGAIISYDMIYDEEPNDSLRYTEYSVITLPVTIEEMDFVDIRLRLKNGQDLIVASKKEIISIYGQTVGLNLTEEEILILNSAIVERFIMPASELYMTKYVEPDIQTAAISTYIPTQEVRRLIEMDSNIINEAKQSLRKLYGTTIENGTLTLNDNIVRQQINNDVNQYGEDAKYNIEAGMQQQIEAARKAREDYLSEMEGY